MTEYVNGFETPPSSPRGGVSNISLNNPSSGINQENQIDSFNPGMANFAWQDESPPLITIYDKSSLFVFEQKSRFR